MSKLIIPYVLLAMVLTAVSSLATDTIVPPMPTCEFRAAWVTTIGTADWPSKPGLSTSEQKSELIAILDRVVALKMNAVIFQVRPACDAMYQSDLEPWSEYLTGTMGLAPSPYYDPLAFAISEAHQRGLELHAWFNPFRAHHFQSTSPVSTNHISKTHPQLVRKYGGYFWLDPGDPEVRDYSLRVVMDVLKRYDIDGVHFDDYFYPFRQAGEDGREIKFPDDLTWKQYGGTNHITRDDWRRNNVNLFMEQVYHTVKAAKPWVKVGISPFGIWRPEFPPTVTGLDAYSEIYADSRKWLHEGWCDYFAPELYWPTTSKNQNFSALLDWWNGENASQRYVWPGLNTDRVGTGWQSAEIVDQINLTRKYPNPGHLHWSMLVLMKNALLGAALTRDLYPEPALIPPFPWLDPAPPALPKLSVTLQNNAAQATWSTSGDKHPSWWLLQSRTGTNWSMQILPASQTEARLDAVNPNAIVIRAVSRTGILSESAIWTRSDLNQKRKLK